MCFWSNHVAVEPFNKLHVPTPYSRPLLSILKIISHILICHLNYPTELKWTELKTAQLRSHICCCWCYSLSHYLFYKLWLKIFLGNSVLTVYSHLNMLCVMWIRNAYIFVFLLYRYISNFIVDIGVQIFKYLVSTDITI